MGRYLYVLFFLYCPREPRLHEVIMSRRCSGGFIHDYYNMFEILVTRVNNIWLFFLPFRQFKHSIIVSNYHV